MNFDYPKHRSILIRLLKDIYTDASLAPYLGFKGGTAALLFYGLDRRSVDLDFDLLDHGQQTEVFKKLEAIAKTHGTVDYSKAKRFSLLNVISYAPGVQKIKVEVNLRDFGSAYDLKTLLGIPMLVMKKEDMFANKLMAMLERLGQTSRDVYDVHFFFKQNWDINQTIVEKRAKLPYKDTLTKCIKAVKNMDNRHILDGLGDLLDDPQKQWARAKLKEETLFLLKLALETA